MDHLWTTLTELVRRDVAHRRGWKPSQNTDADMADALVSEALEVRDEPTDRDELADVLVLVFRQAQRLGCSQQELEARAIAKLNLRFPELCATPPPAAAELA